MQKMIPCTVQTTSESDRLVSGCYQCGTHINRDAVEKVAALLVLCQDGGIRGVISGESPM